MAALENNSPSPHPQQPLTKRDVRRNRIVERLDGMISAFSANQHQHYRAQLQAIQVDMTLILRADPYNNDTLAGGFASAGAGGQLEDDGEEIRSLIESIGAALPNDEAAQRDYWTMAGTRYRQFAKEVNDSIEQRDADLTALHDHYKASLNELERLTQQKLHQAEEEHKALSATIRQRLITSITKKRQQLLRDKEQLDVADSNALLLHPSHFSINNPGSPSLGVRKTRHLRHRAGSPNVGDMAESKRKRKLGAMEDDGNESPVPGFKPLPVQDLLGGGRSPFKDARDKNTSTQYEAPAYSLERLFTDKELALATDTAKNATYRYFHQPQQKQDEHGTGTNGTAVPSVDGEVPEGAEGEEGAVNTATDTGTGTPPPAAVEMARETSQVLTRGSARANPTALLSELADIAVSTSAAGGTADNLRNDPFAPRIPNYHAVTRSEKSGAPAPGSVTPLDIENDFEMMRQTAVHGRRRDADGDETMEIDDPASAEAARIMRNQLLDQALGSTEVSQPYRLPLLDTGPALIGRGVERLASSAFAPSLAVDQQRLRGGANQQTGSMAAALQGRFAGTAGGEAMSRTTSAGMGSEVGTDVAPPAVTGSGGRRGRGRLV